MTIVFIVLSVCVYDLCCLLTVLYINRTENLDAVKGADNIVALVFWPLLVLTRIGIAIYRIVRRLL